MTHMAGWRTGHKKKDPVQQKLDGAIGDHSRVQARGYAGRRACLLVLQLAAPAARLGHVVALLRVSVRLRPLA